MTRQPDKAGPVVVGIDGSDQSMHALRGAMAEAGCRGAELHVVHVNDVTPAVLHLPQDVTVHTSDIAEVQREEIWAEARGVLDRTTVEVEFVGIEGGHAADALIAYCERLNAQLLVVGPRGRGRVTELLLGSTAHNVIGHSCCDVLVVRPGT